MDTSSEKYAVVSCHVERVLDDHVWSAFARLQARKPGGFAIAALLRPPDRDAGERDDLWVERARDAVARGPLGHHTHWTSPTHARPSPGGELPGDRVLREGRWLREQGLEPTVFCGGGWYTDESVARACATLGYADCTPRATRPGYLDADAPWAQSSVPARAGLGGGQRVVVVPTTHSVGDLVRALARPRGLTAEIVHVYFHDTDLLDTRRSRALVAGLRLLALRRKPLRLDDAVSRVSADAAPLEWASLARGGAADAPQ